MIIANWIAVFPLVTTPWWIWAMVILATLAVLGVSIFISARSNSENPPTQPHEHTPAHPAGPPASASGSQAEPSEKDVHVAPRTAEFDTEHMEVALPGGDVHVPSQYIELPPPDLLPEEIDEKIENNLRPDILTVGSDRDDLKLVRGISPSTAAVLHQAGIYTFAQLAAADVDDLEKILRAAGMRTLDPRSWPEQAQLAAAGDWGALGQFQERLKEKK